MYNFYVCYGVCQFRSVFELGVLSRIFVSLFDFDYSNLILRISPLVRVQRLIKLLALLLKAIFCQLSTEPNFLGCFLFLMAVASLVGLTEGIVAS